MDDEPSLNLGGGLPGQTHVKPPSVLLAASKWWPLSARLASALLQQRCAVAAMCPRRHPLTHVPGIHRIYRYGGILSLVSLQRAIHDRSPDIIVPCDDGVVAQLHAIHEVDPQLRGLIERSLGPVSSFETVRSRHRLLALAEAAGVPVPRTQRLSSRADLDAWHAAVPGPAVLKVAGESGGNGIKVCRSLQESIESWNQMMRTSGYATACKRLVIDRNPLTLWQRQRATPPEVTIQAFIRGQPANSMMLCRRGEVLATVSVIVVAAESAVGAATVVRVIDDPRMKFAAEELARRLQLSGFFGLDFVVDESGAPFLIELNPRCTQLGHLELPERASLAAVLAASLRHEAPPPPLRPIRRRTIALFPQALAGGPSCAPYIDASHHDVPQDAPGLVHELTLRPWPQRQWRSRLYHCFSRMHRNEPVLFEAPEAMTNGEDAGIYARVLAVTR